MLCEGLCDSDFVSLVFHCSIPINFRNEENDNNEYNDSKCIGHKRDDQRICASNIQLNKFEYFNDFAITKILYINMNSLKN